MSRKQTFSSPYLHAINPEAMGADPFVQHELVIEGVKRYMDDPFERGTDLRGTVFTVKVHKNGLHVTIEAE